MSSAQPLLVLTMIVKDEERTIARTLESVKPFVDRWLILDTGSTDRTKEVVRAAFGDKPGELAEAPFVDFATTRNHALDLCDGQAAFVLWLDADDQLQGGAELRAFLEKERGKRDPDREAYYVRVTAGVTFDSARVLRSGTGWRFRGVVHEVLTKEGRPPPSQRIPGPHILHEPDARAAERSRRRWERDLGLLGGALERDPSDTRAAFYLGLTYFWLGRWEEAMKALDRRAEMGGWIEEVFQARLHQARAAESAGRPWPEVLDRYLAAHAVQPHRAEPLYHVALRYNAHGEHALCLLFARRGWELRYPDKDTLFVESSIYRWRLADLVASSAYWLGEREIGEVAARQAVKNGPADARLQKNLEFYLKGKPSRKARRARPR
jgi:glycosyltransferase involved in cell wall biosynthesis